MFWLFVPAALFKSLTTLNERVQSCYPSISSEKLNTCGSWTADANSLFQSHMQVTCQYYNTIVIQYCMMAVAACESHSGKVWFFFSPQRIDAEKVGHLEIQVWSKYTWTIIEPIVRQIMFIGLLYASNYRYASTRNPTVHLPRQAPT